MAQATSQTLERELDLALSLAREAGAAILGFYRKPIVIEQKDSFSDSEPVTQADRVANDLIVRALEREFPDDGILDFGQISVLVERAAMDFQPKMAPAGGHLTLHRLGDLFLSPHRRPEQLVWQSDGAG